MPWAIARFIRGTKRSGSAVGGVGDLAERAAGREDPDVVMDLRVGERVEAPLLRRRARAVGEPGARDVDGIAVPAHEIGVEAHEIARLDHIVAALVVPGIGARAGGQESRLHPFAAELGIGLAEDGPERLLGDAGAMRRLHAAQALLAGADRVAHRLDLVRRLDRAREVEEREPVDRHQAFGGERCRAGRVEPVECDAAPPPPRSRTSAAISRAKALAAAAAFGPAAM